MRYANGGAPSTSLQATDSVSDEQQAVCLHTKLWSAKSRPDRQWSSVLRSTLFVWLRFSTKCCSVKPKNTYTHSE